MKIRLTILFGVLLVFVSATCCKSKQGMDDAEINLINTGSAEERMPVLSVVNKEDLAFLRSKAQNIDTTSIATDEALQKLIKRMVVTLDDEGGVGLAAPQVGIGRNLFLFTRIKEEGMPYQVAINPRIISHPDTMVCFENDGCLSIPNVSGTSMRYAYVDVEYYDETGKKRAERLEGYSRRTDYTGIVFQHEYDHLQGILFIDKLCE